MSFSELLRPEVQNFLLEHEGADEAEFVLKGKSILGIPASLLAEQLRGRRKAKDKLPSFYKAKDIIYPPQLNLEQSSSEVTAKFKASLVKGNQLIDLTGGFGVDSFFFSKKFINVLYKETNIRLL